MLINENKTYVYLEGGRRYLVEAMETGETYVLVKFHGTDIERVIPAWELHSPNLAFSGATPPKGGQVACFFMGRPEGYAHDVVRFQMVTAGNQCNAYSIPTEDEVAPRPYLNRAVLRKERVAPEPGVSSRGGVEPKDLHVAGAKDDDGKPLTARVLGGFSNALNAVAEVGTAGAKKYTLGGWKAVPDGFNRYDDAYFRHALKRLGGEERDPDSGQLHLAHEAWNALARLELYLKEKN